MLTTTVMMVALAMTGQNPSDKQVASETPGTIARPSERRQQELAATAARRRYVRARARQHNAVADMQTAAMVDGIVAYGVARGAAESARMAGAQAGRTGPSSMSPGFGSGGGSASSGSTGWSYQRNGRYWMYRDSRGGVAGGVR